MLDTREIKRNGYSKTQVPALGAEEFGKDPFIENYLLSVIIRCHRQERLPFLEEALYSLSIQEWNKVELIIVIQDGTEDFVEAIENIIPQQPWPKEPKIKIHTIEFHPGVDGRSSLLNWGISNATGRFLAFLDDDDVVYHHAYTTLINTLLEGQEAAVAVGGCRTAKTSLTAGQWYISAKETPFTRGRNRYDLYRDNFIPIHSYVIDRKRVKNSDLYFDDEMPPLEDYDFLLRLSSKYEFDFSNLDVFVCEYRIHNSNSIPYTADATQDQITKHQRAYQLIEQRKRNLLCLVPLQDLSVIRKNGNGVEQFQTTMSLNPKILQKVLVRFSDKAYSFFKSYPKIEKRLSNIMHFLWDIYEKKQAP